MEVLLTHVGAVAVPAVVAALLPVLEDHMTATGVFVVPIDTHLEWVWSGQGGEYFGLMYLWSRVLDMLESALCTLSDAHWRICLCVFPCVLEPNH